MNRKEAITIATRMRAAGSSYSEIAKHLNSRGFILNNGAAPNETNVWWLVSGNGSSKNTRTKKKRISTQSAETTSKWDVLRAIDECAEIDSDAKRAIIELVMQEVVFR
jgi:hypothetical protein